MSARKKATAKKAGRKAAKKSAKKSGKKAAKKNTRKAAKKAARKSAKKASAKKPAAKKSNPRASAAARKPASRKAQSVFSFGDGRADGRADMKEVLGGKGANLAEMNLLGIPVPPGFTISTEVCADFNKAGGALPRAVKAEIATAIAEVESIMGGRFGDPDNPLLFSVRSGARASMPGMMDTVLNLGLNAETVLGLAARAGERFAYDSYRRFIQMYGDVVLNVPRDRFEMRIDDTKHAKGIDLDTDLDIEDLKRLVRDFLEIAEEQTGRPFPSDPMEQLWGAIGAVFSSWQNQRAQIYRRLHNIPEEWGTAVNVQAMVFGNMGDDCATGVAFTRDPSTGERDFYGEYLTNAQGEDVVAGVRTPQPINDASRTTDTQDLPTLEAEMPKAYRELVRIYKRLEKHYRDMQDIEFTIQQGKLWMLQTRAGKRTSTAAVKIAVDMAKERLISREEALIRVDAASLDKLLHPTLDPEAPRNVIARGLPASPGAAVGVAIFDSERADLRTKAGEKVVLVRIETSAEDIGGMFASEGILTARGGMTSHAAVVARGMGKCCVTGCGALDINYEARSMRVGGVEINEGDLISIDGGTGDVMLGSVPTVTPELGGAFDDLMHWADKSRKIRVRTNADTPEDARIARDFGAEGIGLCRTEHMFFEPDRILRVREMILAKNVEERAKPLGRLLQMQRQDFVEIFRAMDALPVTVRLLDPPLHEFLPQTEAAIKELAEDLGTQVAKVRASLASLHEFNPMLGHRGCRLGVTFPDIYRMQVRAIAEAACIVDLEGVAVTPEIMIPLVSHEDELKRLRAETEAVIDEVRSQYPGSKVKPAIGTMIEVPRACIVADVIAEHADFFSFGTNDLTQMGYALSRDDSGKFLPEYVDAGILEDDPFVSIDEEGIGALVQMGAAKGRSTRPRLKLGICGEHGGDPKSVKFFARVGLDYVSCSPFRVPAARLAAAQAAIEEAGA
ncbi:MAG: pyruvate, phosphate dikinase [Myxococcota bacterium]|nr:pyruvate, phosphate dikinase [Myxococcota bacterium]